MAEPRSRRARIMVNLQKQLETITTENGYTTNVVKVTTAVKNWTDTAEAETPVLYIIDEVTNPIYGPSKHMEWEWTIGIYGVMKNKDQVSMEELIADIMECVFKNQTLYFGEARGPGPAAQIRIGGVITDNQLFSEIEGSQLFKVPLIIKYSACADNPR